MKIPEVISRMIENHSYKTDDIGMSGSSVRIYEDKVLKIQDYNKEAENEYGMMRYLQGKLPVPRIIAQETAEGRSYLLMSRCKGQMACCDGYMADPSTQCKLLAAGLKKLWSTDISDINTDIFDQGLSRKLFQAEYNVKNGLVDLDNVEPDTFGENGFQDPLELLEWLRRNRPEEEEPVLSHGDYCLPNLFGIGKEITGYIDLGRAGIADKWCDIAICYRSLSHNHSGKYHRKYEKGIYPDLDDMLLFRELEIEPNWEKINYYILLDELF